MTVFIVTGRVEKAHPEQVLPDSPTHRVGGKILDGFEKYSHQYPLYSLQDAFSREELDAFDARVRKELDDVTYICEFENWWFIDFLDLWSKEFLLLGRLVVMVQSVRISQKNLKRVKDIPLSLPEKLDITVRGECYMPRASFDQVNQSRQENGEPEFANPRNAAAGTFVS